MFVSCPSRGVARKPSYIFLSEHPLSFNCKRSQCKFSRAYGTISRHADHISRWLPARSGSPRTSPCTLGAAFMRSEVSHEFMSSFHKYASLVFCALSYAAVAGAPAKGGAEASLTKAQLLKSASVWVAPQYLNWIGKRQPCTTSPAAS